MSLTPDSLDGAVVSGSRVVRSASVPLDRRLWRDAWGEGLIAFDAPLASLFRQLKAGRGARVSVLAPSPTTLLDVSGMTGSEAAALQAARLRIGERADAHASVSTVDATALAYDEVDGTERTHVLSVAEDDRSAQAVMGWIARSGGRLVRYTPRSAIIISQLIEAASDDSDEGSVWCLIDRTCSVIAAVEAGRLLCVRAIEVGCQSLAEAYARGVAALEDDKPADHDADEPALDMVRATRLLFEHGVPARDAKIGSLDSPYRRDVAPLLAPVVQRLSIEIKQTIRFGISGVERRFSTMRLLGPGAAIPGLATLLTDTTELHTSAADAEESSTPFAPGTAELEFARGHGPDLQLLPVAAVERMRASHRVSALRTGAFFAAGLLAIEAGLIALDRSILSERRDQQRPALELTREEQSRREQAGDMASELGLAWGASNIASGMQPDWFALLAETAALTRDEVLLTEFRSFYEGADAIMVLEGVATDKPDDRTGAALGRFMEQLGKSTLVTKVELGSTSVDISSATPATRFRLRCVVRGFDLSVREPELFVGVMPDPKAPQKKKGRS